MSPVTVFLPHAAEVERDLHRRRRDLPAPGARVADDRAPGMRGTGVGAQQAGTEAAVDALIGALKDTDAGVRR